MSNVSRFVECFERSVSQIEEMRLALIDVGADADDVCLEFLIAERAKGIPAEIHREMRTVLEIVEC